jgi:hypothetical protein
LAPLPSSAAPLPARWRLLDFEPKHGRPAPDALVDTRRLVSAHRRDPSLPDPNLCPFCGELMDGKVTIAMITNDLDDPEHAAVVEHAECKCRVHRRCRNAWMNGDRALEALCPGRTRKEDRSRPWHPTCPMASRRQ